ncbi:T9SS type A sorting domain-containing protein [Phaeocystidibacter luteus]|uniref:T9SS type A sorting domain-containing protein n=1 Tax=Phaeocystidibacter luteus TaxID=911197 RepID=A0A6N6RKU5_9FLAO|nr:T9SS type A sorting domain-containing protein [Phaeocystidibacter luteus]KAB2809803.1 T9SS type A sorting domain-containing protein [Phaeocystidibacter luteus]
MLSRKLIIALAIVISLPVSSQTFTELFRTSSPWPTTNVKFGSHVELNYPYLFVANPERPDTVNGSTVYDVGGIAVYKPDAQGQWQLLQTLSPDTAVINTYFGRNISSYGDRMVCTGSKHTTSTGYMYSFVKGANGMWVLDQVLTHPNPIDSIGFGSSTAMNDNTLAVGCLGYDFTSNQNGTVALYSLDSLGQWQYDYSVTDTSASAFGSSVALEKDWLLVGARATNRSSAWGGIQQQAGSAHFFRQDSSGQYVYYQDAITYPAWQSFIGTDVAMDGDRAVVGASGTDTYWWYGSAQPGAVYCYSWNPTTGAWGLDDYLSESMGIYGYSVDVSGDKVFVGSPYHFRTNPYNSRTGKVFIYEYDSVTNQYPNIGELSSGSLDSNTFFGFSIAADKNTILVGESSVIQVSSRPGRAFLFGDSCQVSVWDTVTNCAGSYTWRDNVTYAQSADTLTYLHYSTVGCDTLYNLHLTVNSADTAIQIIVSCEPYTWIDGITYTTTTDSASVSFLNKAGCDSTILLEFYLNAPDNSVTQVDSVLTANDLFADYQWVDCLNGYTIIQGETNQTFTASANGQYAVIVNRGSCYDTSACYIVEGIGDDEYFLLGDIVLTPNPSNGSFSLQSSNSLGGYIMRIVDVQGKVCTEKQLGSETNYRFETELIPGVYTVLLIGENRTNHHFKLIIQ